MELNNCVSVENETMREGKEGKREWGPEPDQNPKCKSRDLNPAHFDNSELFLPACLATEWSKKGGKKKGEGGKEPNVIFAHDLSCDFRVPTPH